jgi:protein-tyrosine phosphatase
MHTLDATTDVTSHHIEDMTRHGGLLFNRPLITHIDGNLWMGGCLDGVRLPDHFTHVVSLHPWERFELPAGASRKHFWMYDSSAVDVGTVAAATESALDGVANGPTLVHCQAGLNRSALVSSLVLVAGGRSVDQAIALLRSRRSPDVLSNRAFETWLRGLQALEVA